MGAFSSSVQKNPTSPCPPPQSQADTSTATGPRSSSTERTLTPPCPPAQPTVFRFMDLPAELRLIVYEELVVVGKVFYTPDEIDIGEGSRFKNYKLYRKPSLAILGVSQRVRSEAEELYLTKNLFVLPHLWHLHEPFVDDPNNRALFSASAGKIKHISVAFCTRAEPSLHPTVTRRTWDYYERNNTGARHIGPFDQTDAATRMVQVHQYALDSLELHRDRIWRAFAQFLSKTSIEIDLTNAYCAFGCCRLLDLGWWELDSLMAEKYRILGLRNDAEATAFVRNWTKDVGPMASIYRVEGLRDDAEATFYIKKWTFEEEQLAKEDIRCIDINPDTDSWEEWKMDGLR